MSLSIYKDRVNLVTIKSLKRITAFYRYEKGSTLGDLSCYSEPTAKMGEETRLSDAHLHDSINKARVSRYPQVIINL